MVSKEVRKIARDTGICTADKVKADTRYKAELSVRYYCTSRLHQLTVCMCFILVHSLLLPLLLLHQMRRPTRKIVMAYASLARGRVGSVHGSASMWSRNQGRCLTLKYVICESWIT
jgi:hypothetical protein